MRLHHGLLAVYLSLAENQSIGQGGATTGDVDGATTGIIERWQVIEPAAGVPGPAGDGAVDDRGPPEAKEQRWDDTAALESSTDHDHDRADAEEELVEAEDNLGEIGATWGRCRGDVLETEVCEITDEGTSRSRIGEGITPEHPLEGDDLDESLSEKQLGGALRLNRASDTYTNDRKTLVQHGKRGLATGQTSIQQSQAGDDHPDEVGADDQVDGVEFEPGELSIDIDLERISAIGGGLVELRLRTSGISNGTGAGLECIGREKLTGSIVNIGASQVRYDLLECKSGVFDANEEREAQRKKASLVRVLLYPFSQSCYAGC